MQSITTINGKQAEVIKWCLRPMGLINGKQADDIGAMHMGFLHTQIHASAFFGSSSGANVFMPQHALGQSQPIIGLLDSTLAGAHTTSAS